MSESDAGNQSTFGALATNTKFKTSLTGPMHLKLDNGRAVALTTLLTMVDLPPTTQVIIADSTTTVIEGQTPTEADIAAGETYANSVGSGLLANVDDNGTLRRVNLQTGATSDPGTQVAIRTNNISVLDA